MVRYIALQYREELGILQDKEFSSLEGTQPPGAPVRRRPPPRTRFLDEEKHQIASDLLVILSKIRIEVIAVNSISLVAKIRFVASTLLDALQQPQNSTDPRTLEGNARAQGHLCELTVPDQTDRQGTSFASCPMSRRSSSWTTTTARIRLERGEEWKLIRIRFHIRILGYLGNRQTCIIN